MTQPQYSVAEFAARIKEKYPAYADVDDQELVSRILEKYPQYGEQIKKKDDTESVLDDGSLASPEIAVAESVRTPVVPEPVEVLDETPARTLESRAEQQQAITPVGQSVAVDVPAAPEPVLDFVTGDEEFDKSLGFVNADLVDRGDERQVARELTAEFKDFGFDFESTGIGDAIKVTARNGETMEVDLDPAWYNFGVDEGEEAKSLRKFLTDNKDTSELIDAEDAFKEADLMMDEYRIEEEDIVKEFDDVIAQLGEYSEDDVRANPSEYQRLVEKHNEIVGRYQRWSIESADARVMYNEALANVERLSKPKERQTALERTFGRNSFTNWVSDFSTRAIDQGLAQGATIRENLNLAINANDVTDEELDDFRRAVLAAAEAGPSDEMQEFGRRVEEKTKGMSYGGKLLTTLFEVAKNPSILPELTVSSVAMMANKEVVLGGLPTGAVGLFAGPGGALTGFAAGTATTLEAGLSFGEFMMEELAAKQGVDINEVDMSNESLREVLSDGEAMSRMRNRAAGRGVAMGLFNMFTKNVASGVTRRVVGKTGSKMKGILAAGAVDMPLESAGEAIGRIAGRQEMDPMEIVLEGAAKGPGFVIGVAEGLVRSPKYTLNGERVGGKTMAKFINEASEADVAGATIEIKNDKVLAGIANDKRNAARERQIIGKQLRESGITDEAKVQALTDLEMEKRKLAGNETTAGKRKRERIQREIDATLEGDSYFFEETTDEQGNTVSNEVRVTRAEAIQALKDDDITRPTEREIEQKQAELFRDAMAAIGKEDAIQEPSTEEVDVGEQPADGEEVGVGDAEEEVVAEAEEAEAQELAERLEAEGTPDVTEQLGDNITAERRQGTTLGTKQEKIVAQAKKRAAALANSIPGLQVKLYETTDQYQRATGLDGKGGYTYENDVDADGNVVGKKNRVIHINLETANTRTVAHEAFHAMFLENLSDQEYQKQAKALMSTVRKALADDSDMARRIDEFVAAYDEAEIDEEALSEIFGYISNGYGQLSAPEQSRIKAAIKALIERVTGIKLESGWSEGDQNVLDVLNTLAQKLEAGEEVTAEEIGALRVGEERVAEVEAEVDIDSRIAAAQEKVRGIGEAALEALGELANLATEVDEEAGLNLVKSVRKAISEKKASATIKKMRDVKKSKRMSADDKAERLTKLEAQLEGELERLNAEREKAAPKIAEAVERLKAKAETKRAQAAKEKRLAEIKEEGKAITKERAKAIKGAKKEFEGEELKTALEVIEEETKAKRDKLKAEKAELEKKTEAPVVEEAAPVEETPVVEETPTVGTIRTKVGVEAFGKLEAAVRSYLEYMGTVPALEEEQTRGQKSAVSRRINKLNKLFEELGLTDAEQAVMQRSVRDAISEEQRAEANRKAEAAERKAAAERAKKAAEEAAVEEPTVEEKPTKRERTGDGEYIIRHRGSDFVVRKTDEGYYVGYQTDNPDETTDANNWGETFRTIKEAIEYADRDFEKFGPPAEPTVEEVTPEPAVEKAPVDDVAKRAAFAGVSVEELTKQEAAKERQRKDTLSRQTLRTIKDSKAEVKKLRQELKGKKGEERKPLRDAELRLKEAQTFLDNLGTMSVNEALRLRTPVPSAREQRVESDEIAAVRFDLFSLREIGRGSSRVVYDLGDGRALKVALNAKGLEQNQTLGPWDVETNLKGFIPLVFEEGPDYLVVENVTQPEQWEGPNGLKAMMTFLSGLERVYSEAKIQEYLESVKEGMGRFTDYELLLGDFKKPDSWGMREDGTIVLVDEGALNPRVYLGSEPQPWAIEDFARIEEERAQYESREQERTEGKLKAREQRVVDFTEERFLELGRQGIFGHGSRMDISRFDEDFISTVVSGYGFYFTNFKPEARAYGDRVTFVDTSGMTLRDATQEFTPEESEAIAARLMEQAVMVKGSEKAGDMFLLEELSDMVEEGGFSLSDFHADGTYPLMAEDASEGMGYYGAVLRGLEDAGGPKLDGVFSTRPSSGETMAVLWNFDKINESIVEPKAREQKASEVLGRYKFRPDGSLIGDARLANELRGYMRKFGFGVEQFGTREDRYHIVDERGRKVKAADVIAKDIADTKKRIAEGERQDEQRAERSLEEQVAKEARDIELKALRDEFIDFPEEMIPPSTKNFRQQKGQLGAATEGLSTAAVVQFAKERGFSDKAILAIRPGAQQAIDKYDERAARVNREVQGIIQRTRERARGDKDIQAIENKARRTRAVNDRIEEDVLAYLKGTKFYKDASDVGREAMIRAVRKQMGRRMKSAPSVIKLGIDNGIPTIDKRDLNRQIKMIAESSRQTALAMREAMRVIGKDIELMQAKGLITGKQATLILKKLAATDPLNPVQVEKFTDYAARVFANAEYEQEVKRLNARRKRAFKQFETKLGVHKDYAPMLRTLLLIDATMIPQEVLEEYGMLIDMLGERKAVLDLDQSVIVGDLTTKVMTAIDEELSMKEELLARYENYPGKKKGFSSTIDAMVKDDVLSDEKRLGVNGEKLPSEADVLRKYISELAEEEKSEGQRQQEAEEKARRDDREMARLRQALLVLRKPEVDFGMREERELVKKFYRMVKTEAVEGLTLPELKNALRVADNIENGFLPHMAQVLVEKMDAHQKARQVERAIKEARIPKRKLAYSKVTGVFGGPNATLELIKRNPLRYIDQVLGDFKSSRVYDAVFKPLAKAYAQYNSEMISIQERLDKVEARLVSKYKRNPNAITRSKFLIGAYMMQREFENNVGVDGVFSAEDLLQATIDADGVGEAYYTGKTTEMLEGILEEIKGKTADEIEASLNEDEKAVAEEIRAINDELTPKAQYVAGVIRGVPFRPFSQYFHRVSLKEDERAGLRGMSGLIEQVNKNMRPSTRAKNLEVRTGSIGPVNFDPFASANRGAKFVLTDYYMTEPVRTAGRMANDLKGVKELTAAQKSLRDALTGKRGAINTAIADVLVQSYTINTQFDKLKEFIKKQAYRMALADGPRFIAELLSNLAFVGFANPGGFAEGVRMMRDIKTMREHSGVDILRNVGSVQTTRLFPKPDTISSRIVDSLRTSLGPDKSRVGGEVENKLRQIWAQTAQRAQDAKVTSQLADWMITTPDKMVTQPVWFGVFSNTFKEQTGQEVDFTKLAENDEAYMNQYEDAIKAATDAADDASVRTGATDNAFLGILRGTIRPDDSPVQSWFAMANSYMTRFLIFEYATARTAIQAAIGNGTISKGEGRRLIIATSARMVLYSFIVDILRRELDKALGLSDDDDEKEAGELMGDALLTGATSLMFGRTSGQIGRGLKGMLVENLNENYLHPDDYDYDERIMMPLIDLKAAERRPYKAINDVVTASLGPYGAPARTLVFAIKKATEKDRVKGSAIDRQEAEWNRLYLELAGVGGFIPLYKDLRRLYIKEIYKDLD